MAYWLSVDVFRTRPTRFPLLGIRLELRKRDANEVVWAQQAFTHIDEDICKKLDQRSLQDYLQDPVLLDTQFRKASDLLTGQTLPPL